MAGGLGAPRRVAGGRRGGGDRARAPTPAVLRDTAVVLAGDPQGEVRGQDLDAHRRGRRRRSAARRRRWTGCALAAEDLQATGRVGELVFRADDGAADGHRHALTSVARRRLKTDPGWCRRTL